MLQDIGASMRKSIYGSYENDIQYAKQFEGDLSIKTQIFAFDIVLLYNKYNNYA